MSVGHKAGIKCRMNAFKKVLIIASICQITFCQDIIGCQSNRLEVSNDNRTILRLSKENAQNLKYKWDVTFTRLDQNCKQLQRCNLKAWEATRYLQKYLNNFKVNPDNPEIIIDDLMITPGVQFTIDVTVSGNGIATSHQQFILPQNKTIDRLSFDNRAVGFVQLVGPNLTYADAEYYLDANVSVCNTVVDAVKMQWDLLDDTGQEIRKFDQSGLDLRIAQKLLTADKKYLIRGSAILNSTIIGTKHHNLAVMKRGLALKLNTKTLTVGVNESIRLIAFVQNPDNTGSDFDLDWSCKFEGKECEDFNSNGAILEMETGFSESGRYEISIKIEKGEDLKTDTCIVNVINGIQRTIEVYEIKDVYNLLDPIEITVRVTNLVTGCLIDWMTLWEEGYESLNFAQIPGYQGLINVSLKADAFLEELADIGNETIEKDFTLLIPPEDGNWGGIRGDSSYLLRLNVVCPEANSTTRNISADIAIKTNAGPILKPLEVTPNTGFALITKFTFKTEQADEILTDHPIIYKFGYVTGNITSYFKILGDQYTTETVLPYSETGVQTILKACDSRASCSMAKGPIIDTRIPEDISEDDDVRFKAKFTSLLSNGDYNKAFVYAMALLQTYRKLSNDLLEDDMDDFITEKINDQFNTIITNTIVDDELRASSDELIKQTKILADVVKLPEGLLNNIIKLRAKFSEPMRARIVTDQETISRLLDFINILDSKDIESFTLENVKDYLESAEFIIRKSEIPETVNDQKQSIIIHLDKYLGRLCSLLYRGQQVKIVLKSLTLSLEKLRGNYFSSFVNIPYTPNQWNKDIKVKFGEWRNAVKELRLCVAKGLFNDYFNSTQINYFVDVYNANTYKRFKPEMQLKNYVIMERDPSYEQTCAVFDYNNWQSCQRIKVSPKHILCDCNGFGYYGYTKMELSERNISQNIPIELPPITTALTAVYNNNNDGPIEDFTTPIKHVPTQTSNIDINDSNVLTTNAVITSAESSMSTNVNLVPSNTNVQSNIPVESRTDSIGLTNSISPDALGAQNGAPITNVNNDMNQTPPTITDGTHITKDGSQMQIPNVGESNENIVTININVSSNNTPANSNEPISPETNSGGSGNPLYAALGYIRDITTLSSNFNSDSTNLLLTNSDNSAGLSNNSVTNDVTSRPSNSNTGISSMTNSDNSGAFDNTLGVVTTISSIHNNGNSGVANINISTNNSNSAASNANSNNATNNLNSGASNANSNTLDNSNSSASNENSNNNITDLDSGPSKNTSSSDGVNSGSFTNTISSILGDRSSSNSEGSGNTNSSAGTSSTSNGNLGGLNSSNSMHNNTNGASANSSITTANSTVTGTNVSPQVTTSTITNSLPNQTVATTVINRITISPTRSINDVELTNNQSTDLQKASILSSNNLTTGDEISLIIIGISILGMVLIGIIGAILNRVKRERTIETTDSLEFPKYANIFHPDTMDTISQ